MSRMELRVILFVAVVLAVIGCASAARRSLKGPKLPKEPQIFENPVLTHVPSVELTLEDWKKTISDGVWLVYFGNNWCEHCEHVAVQWSALEYIIVQNPQYKIASVDCDEEKVLCKSEGVQGYPSVFLYDKGEFVADFQGGRSAQIIDFWVRGKLFDRSQKDDIERSLKEHAELNAILDQAAKEVEEESGSARGDQQEKRRKIREYKEKQKTKEEDAKAREDEEKILEERKRQRDSKRQRREKLRKEIDQLEKDDQDEL